MGTRDRPVASNVAAGRRADRLVHSRSRAVGGPAVDFRILGPLEVARDGQPLALGAVQQRALLAVLVLHRGEVVPIDRLIDELWGERNPATAAKMVQVYVSHLRKGLGAGVIVTQRGEATSSRSRPSRSTRFSMRRFALRGDAACRRLCGSRQRAAVLGTRALAGRAACRLRVRAVRAEYGCTTAGSTPGGARGPDQGPSAVPGRSLKLWADDS
jgi:hypothetical protein